MIRLLQSVIPPFLAAGMVGPALIGHLPHAVVVGVLTAAVTGVAALARRLGAGEPRLDVVAAAALIGCLHTLAPTAAPVPPIDEPLCVVAGRVSARYEGRFGTVLIIDEARAAALLTPRRMHRVGAVRVRVRARLPAAIDRGVAVRARGRLATAPPDRIEFVVKHGSALTPATDSLTRAALLVHRLRGRVAACLAERIRSPAAASMAAALLTGGRLDEKTSGTLRGAGVVHLFVVSGLHLALLALGLSRLPPLAGARTGRRPIALALVMTAFAMFTGARPPVMRALAAVWLVAFARCRGRPVDGAWIVLVVGAAHLALSPHLSRDPSFLLSMSAVCGIAFLARPWRDERPDDPLDDFLRRKNPRPLRRALRATLVVSWTATAGTAPASLAIFGRLTPVSVVATCMFAPAVGLLALSAAATLGSARFALLADALGRMILASAAATARAVPPSTVEAHAPRIAAHAACLALAGVLANSSVIGRRWRRIVTLAIPGAWLLAAS